MSKIKLRPSVTEPVVHIPSYNRWGPLAGVVEAATTLFGMAILGMTMGGGMAKAFREIGKVS